jgi:Mg2+-importing ATPase
MPPTDPLSRDSERDLTFLGFLTFEDPIKDGVIETLRSIEQQGVRCKVLTGDNRFVTGYVATILGVLDVDTILTGAEVRQLSSHALAKRAIDVDIFAELDPAQKERIILALKRSGHAVGYLGDGINDAAALHAADVGISVDTAVDVTKEAADIVLTRKDLGLLLEAVLEGRRAFANTLKYVFVSASANFGNMFSMAGASLFTTFIPLLPKQVLLMNVVSDIPALAIAGDRVDPELIQRPLRWNVRTIWRFMGIFGLVSSLFDYLTFGTLLYLRLETDAFRTGWFLESVLSEIMVLIVIRTRRSVWKSPMGRPLFFASCAAALFCLVLPFLPLATTFGFSPFSYGVGAVVAGILILYGAAIAFLKRREPLQIL